MEKARDAVAADLDAATVLTAPVSFFINRRKAVVLSEWPLRLMEARMPSKRARHAKDDTWFSGVLGCAHFRLYLPDGQKMDMM